MNNTDFTELVNKRLDVIKDTLVRKGLEYADNSLDRLINFKIGSKMSGKEPIDVLRGYKLKHDVSLHDLFENFAEGNNPNIPLLNEKITDSICYLILAEALMKEENIRIKNLTENLK